MTLNQLSESLLLAVKQEQPVDALLAKLAAAASNRLTSELTNDSKKIAFWVNCYNAYFQILRKVGGVAKSRIYKAKEIEIARQRLSLDDIEHGILRRYRWKYSAGYLPNIFASRLVKQLAVAQIDWRIHFALNCGAQSCPPIAFYSPEKLEQQLDWATSAYLKTETRVDDEEQKIYVTSLFRWFAGDFGGSRGVREILAKRLKIDANGYRLVYRPWSWDESLGAFADEK